MLSQSRERRARRMDASAVALLMVLIALLGATVLTVTAPEKCAYPTTLQTEGQ